MSTGISKIFKNAEEMKAFFANLISKHGKDAKIKDLVEK